MLIYYITLMPGSVRPRADDAGHGAGHLVVVILNTDMRTCGRFSEGNSTVWIDYLSLAQHLGWFVRICV